MFTKIIPQGLIILWPATTDGFPLLLQLFNLSAAAAKSTASLSSEASAIIFLSNFYSLGIPL